MKKKIIPKEHYHINLDDINKDALSVIIRLKNAGFEAYLVGGGVRDLLMNRHPKDFDIATNALPNDVKKLFRNCRLIGRRFRLAHIRFGRHLVEVATFRAGHEKVTAQGMVTRENIYGTIDQDAVRRDFTINALYYDPEDNVLVDFVDGFEDLKNKTIRIIGDAKARYREDPVRMLRAARFMGKLDLIATPDTGEVINELSHLLKDVSPARLYDEAVKLFQCGYAEHTFAAARHYGLFKQLCPLTDASLERDEFTNNLLIQLIHNTDDRIHTGKYVTPVFFFAALLWYPLVYEWDKQQKHFPRMQAFEKAMKIVVRKQKQSTDIPRFVMASIKEIWVLQNRLLRRTPRTVSIVLKHRRFRAAYDLLLLRAKAGEDLQEHAEWWTIFQEAGKKEQQRMLKALSGRGGKKK